MYKTKIIISISLTHTCTSASTHTYTHATFDAKRNDHVLEKLKTIIYVRSKMAQDGDVTNEIISTGMMISSVTIVANCIVWINNVIGTGAHVS